MKRLLQIGNIAALAFALAANYVVGSQMLDLPSINSISDKYATLLTPASYAFSIWSLIYLLLIIFVAYQARDLITPVKNNNLPQQVGLFLMIANVCNGIWTYVFVREWIGLSVIILLLLSASLYMLLRRLRIAVTDSPAKTIAFVWWPVMIYAGWVTVATLVNIASWFEYRGLEVTPVLASVMLGVLTAALLALLLRRNVRELLLASTWGVAAVGVQQLGAGGNQAVSIVVFGCAGILLVAVGVHAYVNRQSNILAKLK